MVVSFLSSGGLVSGRPAVHAISRRVRVLASSQTLPDASPKISDKAEDSRKSKIYVGKGRFVEDDPSKYPEKTPLTGGFAGGEVGLKKFVADSVSNGSSANKSSKDSNQRESKTNRSAPKNGLYVGKGRYLPYDPSSNESNVIKSTGRDSSLVGGFAGGEVGLRQYVETGEVPFVTEGGSRRRQQSPLIVAGIVSLAAVTGGILLTDVSDLGEKLITGTTSLTPAALSNVDDNTKLLLETAVLLIGVVATVVGGHALIGNITTGLREGATKLGVLAIFWVAVFIAARFILDSP